MAEEKTYTVEGVTFIENPREQQAQFDDVDELIKYVQDHVALIFGHRNHDWLEEVKLVIDYIVRFHRHEKWLQEANLRTPGFIYRVYTQIVLLYALYGNYPGIRSVPTDMFQLLSDPGSWDKITAYRLSKQVNQLPPSSIALLTLWDDVGMYIDQHQDEELISSLDRVQPELKCFLFWSLSNEHERMLLAGEQIRTSAPAEYALQNLYNYFNFKATV